jgi:hypothetical protein
MWNFMIFAVHQNIFKIIKKKKKFRVCCRHGISAYRFLVGIGEGKKSLGTPGCRWEKILE